MPVLGVIPVRMESTRLPGKPLKKIGDKTLVECVWRRAKESSLVNRLVIATDSVEIEKEAKRFGAEVVMTGEVVTGSDRVAAAYNKLSDEGYDCIVNIQGDMPFIKPSVIDKAVSVFINNANDFGMGTIATPILDQSEFERPSCVKVVMGSDDRALYFSRSPVPYPRNNEDISVIEPLGHKHVGLYVFNPETLKIMTSLPQALCEKREGLEQLRLLASGVSIIVAKIPRDEMEPCIEVDTPEDLEKANQIAALATKSHD